MNLTGSKHLTAWGALLAAAALHLSGTVVFAGNEKLTVPVPRAIIYSGDTIKTGDLVEATITPSQAASTNPATSREEIVGRVARRTLLPGQPIPFSATKLASIIRHGQPATAVYQMGALTISATVMPLQSGAVGETVSFQSAESGAVLRGVVASDGTIEVRAP